MPQFGTLTLAFGLEGNTPNGDVDPHFVENAYLLKKKIHLVISHCTANLNWISDFTKGFDISSIHVVTKCGKEVGGAPTNATIEKCLMSDDVIIPTRNILPQSWIKR